ncbi:hypothetical protein NESM_000298900 [Novymonas esmeraldas]|uniref:Uncharacterized protein n=1 Tax=Novymonas esmeraldas TaxID=1808958 RepID=A0AAW0FEM8_9TRYP
MLEFLLRGYLGYLSFVQPVIYGAQLCHSPHPDPVQVTNVTLTLIFAWLLEVADVLFLSSFIAMRWLYLCARIVLALFFAHPRFLGAVAVYQRLFANLVDVYSPAIDSIVVRHVQSIGDSGLIQYGTQVCTGLLRGTAAVARIATALVEASATTTVPAAPLPRRMSQARDTGEVESMRTTTTATPPPPPLRQPTPVARTTALQPPSLFGDDEDEDESQHQTATTDLHGATPPLEVDAWCDMESEEPLLAFLRASRLPREPETVVNRAHRHTRPAADPFDT